MVFFFSLVILSFPHLSDSVLKEANGGGGPGMIPPSLPLGSGVPLSSSSATSVSSSIAMKDREMMRQDQDNSQNGGSQ